MIIDITQFSWSYDPGGYRWRDEDALGGIKPNRFLVPVREDVLEGKNGQETAGFVPFPLWDKSACRTYPVFDRKDLYRRFANTPPTEDGIMQFANSFGELGRGEIAQFMLEQPKKGEPGSVIRSSGPLIAFVKADSFTTWCNEIEAMRLAYRCWKACRLDDEKELADVTAEIDAFSLSPAPDDNEWTNLFPIPRGLKGKVGLLEALTHLCNKGMQGRFSVVLRNDPDKPNPIPCMKPNSLIGALWYQFSETIGDERWRACEFCGEPFQRRSNAKYCTDSHKTMASQRRKKRLGKPEWDAT
jgi:hypothetical protein